jgi:hypothetical protein
MWPEALVKSQPLLLAANLGPQLFLRFLRLLRLLRLLCTAILAPTRPTQPYKANTVRKFALDLHYNFSLDEDKGSSP